MKTRWKLVAAAVAASAMLTAGCASTNLPPMQAVSHVDLQRFMGDWYVIANIPPFIEKGAHNSIENYRLDADGTIPTTFTYRADSFDGEQKRLTSRGFVLDRETNAVWGIQFIWPIKADYRIVHVADDYSQTVIARQKRDYLWIMARTPQIPDADYQRLVAKAVALGYDASRIQKVPQKWN